MIRKILNNNYLHTFSLRLLGIMLVLIVAFVSLIRAQNSNIWTFGYKTGLNFNLNPPVLLNTSPEIEKPNSSASHCDSFGNLLLYSDGFKVYNAKNQLIGNGLAGSDLSNQGVLILPSRKSNHQFFILTISDNGKFKNGLYYSVADLNQNSLTIKNNLLTEGLFLNLTLIPHSNGENYWLIAKKYPDTFYIFQFVNDVLSKPVKVYFSKPSVYRPEKPYHSYLTPSFNGKTLVESCFFIRSLNVRNANYASYVFFYDFNPETGQLTNRQVILVSTDKENGYPKHQYNQASFSPNDSMLYITDIAIYPRSAPLIQLNRYTLEKQEFNSSIKEEPLTAIKTAPDGKIYLTYLSRPYLAIIKNPNKKGTECQFRDNYLKINQKNFTWFAFPNNYFKPTQVSFSYQLRCDSTVELTSISDTSFFIRFVWIFPNGDSALGKKIIYKFGKSGWHTIRLKAETSYGYRQTYSESILLSNQPIADFGYDSNIACQWNEFTFKDQSKTELIKSKDTEKWKWDFGDGHTSSEKNPVHIYTHPGKYTISLIYDNGFCKDTIRKVNAIIILEAAKPDFHLSHDSYCSPYLLKINDATRGIVHQYLYDFGDGSTDTTSEPSHFYQNPGNYKITQYLTSPNGCITKTSKNLRLIQGFAGTEQTQMLTTNIVDNHLVEIKWKTLPHASDYLLLRSNDGKNFQVLSKTKSPYFIDNKADILNKIYYYAVIPVDACGRNADTSALMNHLSLKGQPSSIDYSILQWHDFQGWDEGVKEYILETQNQTGNFEPIAVVSDTFYRDNNFYHRENQLEKCYRLRAVEKEGNHQQSVSNVLCLKYETFIYVPNAFSPNGDGINDSFTVIGMCIKNLQITIMNYWGEVIFSSERNKLYWDGKFNGQDVPAGPYVYAVQAETTEGKILNFEGIVRLIR